MDEMEQYREEKEHIVKRRNSEKRRNHMRKR
jgi:hypothetical protein